jgi:hypothetical protein
MPLHWKIPDPRKTTPALLVAATITVAAFSVGQRADRPEYPRDTAVIPTDSTAPETESGVVNPWAAGKAAVARYLIDAGRACLVSGPAIGASPNSPSPHNQPVLQPPMCCP